MNDLQNSITEQYQLLRRIIDRVEVSITYVSLFIQATAITKIHTKSTDTFNNVITLRTNVQLKRCSYAMRLIVTDNHKNQTLKDQRLSHHMSKAYQWLTIITFGKAQSFKEIADTDVLDQSHVTRLINKTFLAPDIIRAILNGTQQTHLTLKYLKLFRVLPNDWKMQKSLLGFNQ